MNRHTVTALVAKIEELERLLDKPGSDEPGVRRQRDALDRELQAADDDYAAAEPVTLPEALLKLQHSVEVSRDFSEMETDFRSVALQGAIAALQHGRGGIAEALVWLSSAKSANRKSGDNAERLTAHIETTIAGLRSIDGQAGPRSRRRAAPQRTPATV